MKFTHQAILLLVLCCFSALVGQAQQGSEAPLTNTSVIKLIRAGFKEKTVVAIIRSRPNRFNLDPDHLIDLKRNGVGENVILAMLSQDQSFVSDGDDWGDESFFRGMGRPGEKGQPDSEGTDIFGSSGGSKNQSSSRGGGRNSNSGNTVTTGSATVRILRPPTEAGGSPAKLERTPTLNNDSIIQLVEAGFSEGTIIKRIADSPAEFDLSPPKLEELRKRRVSDAIILAMTTAMSDDAPAKPDTPTRDRN